MNRDQVIRALKAHEQELRAAGTDELGSSGLDSASPENYAPLRQLRTARILSAVVLREPGQRLGLGAGGAAVERHNAQRHTLQKSIGLAGRDQGGGGVD